jgi:soluble lytic murein transglycosylase
LGETLIAPMLERPKVAITGLPWAAIAVALLFGSLAGAALAREDAPAAAGPALRAALALEAGGDPAGAAEAYGAVASATPEVADHASELRIAALQKAGRHDAVIAEAEAFRARFDQRWLRRRVWTHEAAAQQARGEEAAARAAWAEAVRGLSEGDERARWVAEIARSQERSGNAAAAAEHWREIWTRHATSPEAREAEQALARLAAADGSLAYRTPAALRERCLRLSGALRNEEALVACEAAIAAAPDDRGLLRERADVLFRMRRYPEAVDAFRALGDDDRMAVFWRTRSLARSGRIDESLATFARVTKGADPELAARAHFLSGTLLEDTDLAAAEAVYRQVEREAPTGAQRSAASWRLAWLAWRRGDFAAAARELERFSGDAPDAAERARGRYWLGRAWERLGRAQGREQLARIANDEPFTYYGWRAAVRAETGAPAAVDVASAPDAKPAAAAALPAAALRRIQILLEAGLDERAALEIQPLAGTSAGKSARLVLAQLLVEAGRFHLAQRLVIERDAEALARRPAPGEEALWWMAWPTAYDGTVERAARRHGVEPALVYAIMREESGYQPDALSVVGARGLTQIMPDTGRRLAADLGAASFDPAELFVPERNLELGAFYLSQLLGRFDGRLSAAIASYNAGPEAVARWLAADGRREDDEWVESIPYDQTRSYVKRVLRSMHVYRALYGG